MTNIGQIMPLIIAIVTLAIGITIFDSLQTDIPTLGATTNESTGTANASGYLAGTLANDWTSSQAATCNGTTTANVTFVDDTGTFVFDGADCVGATTLVSYNYHPAGYISSSLGRTIITYIVPIAIISLFVLAAAIARG